ncbi:MAG: dienelactone hydrolase family protein [Planctomycetes bacterium]|nr:dienelactone hydrolase family protein [Planctomycetota bacterium]
MLGCSGIAMITLAACCALSDAQDLALPGPFPASSRSVTVTRPSSTTFTATVWYPGATNAASAPFHPTCPPSPILTFGHGFFQTVSTYQSMLAHLATHGYTVIATTSEGGLFPNHSNFAADIRTCITHLETQHATSGSFVFQRLAPDRVGVFGHSMGGGATILATAADARVDAAATLAAADTNPSSIAAAANVSVPVLLISGSSDTIVPPAQNQSHYNAARAPKSYPLIAGGFHCGYQDSSSFGCDSQTTLPRAEQLAIVRRQLTGWFDLYIKQDQTRWRVAWGPDRDADTRITSVQDSGLAVSLVSPAPSVVIFGTPAPCTVRVTNTSPRTLAAAVTIESASPNWSSTTINTASIASGQSQDVTVFLSAVAPASAPVTLTLSARSLADGGTRSWLSFSAAAFCPADVNRDGIIDFFDYLDFVADFSASSTAADFNADGTIDFFDYLDFVAAFSSGGC